MEKTTENIEKKKRGRGGARPGAGRKKGSVEQVSIVSLLSTLRDKTKGRDYEELLVEDFLTARDNHDTHAILKYHNLILNKVMNTLAKIEITEPKDQVEMKQIAFAEALAKLTGVKK